MNHKTLAALCIVAALATTTLVLAQSKSAATPASDPRIDKLLEQNEQILKNQEAILKELGQVKDWVDWLRRRSS
jgi:hypothetical protein